MQPKDRYRAENDFMVEALTEIFNTSMAHFRSTDPAHAISRFAAAEAVAAVVGPLNNMRGYQLNQHNPKIFRRKTTRI